MGRVDAAGVGLIAQRAARKLGCDHHILHGQVRPDDRGETARARVGRPAGHSRPEHGGDVDHRSAVAAGRRWRAGD